MAISNPNSVDHRAAVKDASMSHLSSSIKAPKEAGEAIALGLGLMVLSPAMDAFINLTHYQNFIFFSSLSVEKNNSKEYLSFGVFGNVILVIDEQKIGK
jgi:hypothetical protein